MNTKNDSERTGKLAERIFIDTNPLIYLLDNISPYQITVRNFFIEKKQRNAEFYTSTITDAEFFVKPFANRDLEKISVYRDFLREFEFLKCFITEQIAERSADIRAKYPNIKFADSLQLAASIECDCTAFLTNDKQLKNVTEANVVYLGDL